MDAKRWVEQLRRLDAARLDTRANASAIADDFVALAEAAVQDEEAGLTWGALAVALGTTRQALWGMHRDREARAARRAARTG